MKQFKWNITDLILSNAWISYPACVGHITSLHQSLLCCIHERTVHNQDLRELWLHVSCCNQKRTTSYEKLPETTEKYICLFNKMAHKKIKWALFLLAFFFLLMGQKSKERLWITFTATQTSDSIWQFFLIVGNKNFQIDPSMNGMVFSTFD